MKLSKVTVLFLLTMALIAPTIAWTQDPVVFNDPLLEAIVREALGIPTDPIMPADMLNLEWLEARRRGVTDLTGLQYATNLVAAKLDMNRITDLSPLAPLTALSALSVSANQVSDISPLSGLSNLVILLLDGNPITDIHPLAPLTNLQSLDLTRTRVTDLGPLAGLSQLQTLSLQMNPQITDFSAIGTMPSLQRLVLGFSGITDIQFLAGLTALIDLNVAGNQISDIFPLSGMANLQSLTLASNPIRDVSPLSELTTLRSLRLNACPLSWESYCLWLPAIQANNPSLMTLVVDPNPYNCACLPAPTPAGSAVMVSPTDNTLGTAPVTLTFEQVTAGGGTTLVTSTSGPTPPAGFQLGSPATYYGITTTAEHTGLIDVCISYAGISFPGPAEALRLFHYEGGQWVDCTTMVDTQNQTICGVVTSLSTFAILAPQDTTPPVFQSLAATPNVLWPPTHQMVPIAVMWSVTDNLDPSPTVVLQSITMNEGDEADTYDPSFDATTGDGHTLGDIQVDAAGNIFLRAERAGTGTGRTYTLLYEATDAPGNTATATVIVTVPHDAP